MKKIVVYNNLIPFKGYAAMTVFLLFSQGKSTNRWEIKQSIMNPFI